MRNELNELMEFDHVVYSDGHGNVTDDRDTVAGQYAPEVYVELDEAGQMVIDPINTYVSAGWSLVNGFSRQDGYPGPVMHESEFVGGAMADYIRETEGYFAVVVVYGIPYGDVDNEVCGWALAYREQGES